MTSTLPLIYLRSGFYRFRKIAFAVRGGRIPDNKWQEPHLLLHVVVAPSCRECSMHASSITGVCSSLLHLNHFGKAAEV